MIEHGAAIDHEPDRCGQIGRKGLRATGQGQKARPITRSNHSGAGQPHQRGAIMRGALDRFRNAKTGSQQELDFLPNSTAMMNADGTGVGPHRNLDAQLPGLMHLLELVVQIASGNVGLAASGPGMFRIAPHGAGCRHPERLRCRKALQIIHPHEKSVFNAVATGGKSLTGTVIWTASEAEFTPKNVQTRQSRADLVYAVKVNIPNPDGILKIGMPVYVTLEK